MATASADNAGMFRFSGMYGAAWRDGKILAEVIDCSGTVDRNRIDIVLVGTTKMGHKPGREARDGTMRVQKIDTKWEMQVWQFLSQSLADRRSKRDSGKGITLPTFDLTLEYDDPDALGIEKWSMTGCLIWRLPIGFSVGDDTVEREYPITWESETPLYAFEVTQDANLDYTGTYYDGYAPSR